VSDKSRSQPARSALTIGSVIANIANAVPDFFIAFLFTRAIISPTYYSHRGLKLLCLVVLMEFLVLLFSFFAVSFILANRNRSRIILLLIALGLVLTPFALVFGIDLRTMTPFYILAGLVLNRVLFVLFRSPEEINPLDTAHKVLAYIGSLFTAGILVSAGSGSAMIQRIPEDKNMDFPILLAAGALYFTITGLLSLFWKPSDKLIQITSTR